MPQDTLGITDKQIAPNAGIHPTKILGGAGYGSVFGNTYFVNSSHAHSGDGSNKGRRPSSPFNSLRYVLEHADFLVSGRGDVILVGPRHVEALGATALTVATRGVTILGFGNGSSKPAFSWDDVASQLLITASDVRIANLRFTVDAALTGAMVSFTAANFCTIEDCDFLEIGDVPTLDVIDITIDTNNFKFLRNFARFPTAGADAFLSFTGVSDDVTIADNVILGNFSDAAIWGGAIVPLNVHILRNLIRMYNDKPTIDFNGAITGVCAHNYGEHFVAQTIDFTGGALIENYFDVAGNDVSGVLVP